ncbi:hypothetical protein RI367_008706 [Sorochytrium milnesiophthora]
MNATTPDHFSGDDALQRLDWGSVAMASSLLVLSASLSMLSKVGMEIDIMVAGMRCVAQLWVMGKVLGLVFSDNQNLWAVIGLSLVLLLLGAMEGVFNKAKYRCTGSFPIVLSSMLVSSAVVGAVGIGLVIRPTPLYNAQIFIPTAGMIFGGSISAVSLGLRTCLTAIKEHEAQSEILLAFGATRSEIIRPVLKESLRVGILPQLTAMSVIGLVNIPGQLTGQLLAGAPIRSAVFYQQIIVFIQFTSAMIACFLSIQATLRVCIDSTGRLHPERITEGKLSLVDRFRRRKPAPRRSNSPTRPPSRNDNYATPLLDPPTSPR